MAMVELPLMVRWVVGSIPHTEPIELFLVPASDPGLTGLTKTVVCPTLSVVWCIRPLAANRKE